MLKLCLQKRKAPSVSARKASKSADESALRILLLVPLLHFGGEALFGLLDRLPVPRQEFVNEFVLDLLITADEGVSNLLVAVYDGVLDLLVPADDILGDFFVCLHQFGFCHFDNLLYSFNAMPLLFLRLPTVRTVPGAAAPEG